MASLKHLACGLVLGLMAVAPTHAEEAVPAQPEQVAVEEQVVEAAPARAVRLVLPWSRLESLTESQKLQIAELHRQSLAEQRAVRERERQAIMALLSDEQKGELQTLLDREAEARRIREAERRAARLEATAQQQQAQ